MIFEVDWDLIEAQKRFEEAREKNLDLKHKREDEAIKLTLEWLEERYGCPQKIQPQKKNP